MTAPTPTVHVDAGTEPSEVAMVLADVAASLPDRAGRDLLKLLRNDLAERAAPLQRIRHLELLAQMVDANAEVPDPNEDYEPLRARRRREAGEEWPHSRTLAKEWGGWLGAVHAAIRYWLEGGARLRPPASSRAAANDHYSRSGVIDAIIAYHRRFQQWPYGHQFYRWGVLERRLAAYHGKPPPRIPSRYPVERLWPDDRFDGALREAKRRLANDMCGAR